MNGVRGSRTAWMLGFILSVATPAMARPCRTLDQLAFARRTDVHASVSIVQRPDDIRAFIDSSRHPLRVHAGPGADDARAAFALAAVELAWNAQVSGAGFPAPIPDGSAGGDERFDVYLVPLPAGVGGMTVATAGSAATGETASDDRARTSPAFMLLDPTLPDDLLGAYAAHELQHALQFALDVTESLMWVEATAVFWEVRLYSGVTDWHLALPDFQGNPQAPLFATGAALDDIATRPAARYEYGAVLFALYLDEVHGDGSGAVVRALWERAAVSSGSAGADGSADSAVDFLDALGDAGIDPAAAIADFVGWRALVGPWAVPGDGPAEPVPASALLGGWRLDSASLDGEMLVTTDGPYPTGCAVRAMVAPQNIESMPVHIEAAAREPGRDIALSLLVVEPEIPRATRSHTAPGRAHVADIAVPRAATLQVAVCDVTAANATDPMVLFPVSLSIRRTDFDVDVDAPDETKTDADKEQENTEPEPAAPSAWSCQSTGGDPRTMRAGIGILGFAVGIVGLSVRGYRAWKRRRLYRR